MNFRSYSTLLECMVKIFNLRNLNLILAKLLVVLSYIVIQVCCYNAKGSCVTEPIAGHRQIFFKRSIRGSFKKNNFLNRCAKVNGKDILIKNI